MPQTLFPHALNCVLMGFTAPKTNVVPFWPLSYHCKVAPMSTI